MNFASGEKRGARRNDNIEFARAPMTSTTSASRNAIERAMLLIDRDTLEPADFTTLTRSVEPTQFRLPPEGVNLEERLPER